MSDLNELIQEYRKKVADTPNFYPDGEISFWKNAQENAREIVNHATNRLEEIQRNQEMLNFTDQSND